MKQDEIYDLLIKIQAICKSGLVYSKDPYSLTNYKEINELSKGFLEKLCEIKLDRPNYFTKEIYPTPNISVRTVIFNMSRTKVLMVREAKDHTWSLPGGWCDLYLAPSEAAKKECKEEAGVDIEIVNLVGITNRLPLESGDPIPEYVVSFEGRIIGDIMEHEYETDAVGWFDINALPKTSPKVNKKEIIRLINSAKDKRVIFD